MALSMPRIPSTPLPEAEQQTNRGIAFAKAKLNFQAIECFRRAAGLAPESFAAQANLGAMLWETGAVDEALHALETAIRLRPDVPQPHNNLANLLIALGRLDQAVEHCRCSLQLQPSAQAFIALGNALKDQGLLDEAIDAYRHAAQLRPDLAEPAANYLYALHFHPASTPGTLLQAHRDLAVRFAQPLKTFHRLFPNNRDPNRRLKVGYVSPDFREHPVGRFILPLLQRHNQEQVQVHCYANLTAADEMTDRIRSNCEVWRDIAKLDDDRGCELIRSDGIDILVDLTMHLRSSRLLLFARKPAPVQVTYLAYCSTTGVDAIDYRFTDPYLDPSGLDPSGLDPSGLDPAANGRSYVERSVCLPQSYWCYQENPAAPAGNALPALVGEPITFGCLNHFSKVTEPVLGTWSKLLQMIPNSRLCLHAGEGSLRARVIKSLKIDPSRVRFLGRLPMAEYFAQYHQIDIALDPFPYTGGTSTCDALWMGVPVISIAGQTAVSRGGLSILSNIGHPEWVAEHTDGYIAKAVALASDLEKLAAIRASLRGEMLRSPLMDEKRFAVDIESAYRMMWQEYCGTPAKFE